MPARSCHRGLPGDLARITVQDIQRILADSKQEGVTMPPMEKSYAAAALAARVRAAGQAEARRCGGAADVESAKA